MSKREIKEQHKDLEIHVVDLINRFDPSGTGKFTEFLTRNFKEISEKRQSTKLSPKRRPPRNAPPDYEFPVGNNDIESLLISYLTELYGKENIYTLFNFNKHLKENRISADRRDINLYKNWEELQKEVALATIKYEQKRLEKEVLIVFQNEEWLIIRPLTMESSLTYGAGTRWCTASRQNRDYFYRYAHNGVLTYIINKTTGDKNGVFYDINSDDFSIWTESDRRIDSLESNIPLELIKMVYEMSKKEQNNFHYFSPTEKENAARYIEGMKISENIEMAEPESPSIHYGEERERRDATFVGTAIAGDMYTPVIRDTLQELQNTVNTMWTVELTEEVDPS